MSVTSVRLSSGRCAGRATMAESPRGRERTPSREARRAPSEPPPKTGAVRWPIALRQSDLGVA
eukprot:12214488-Alexandrium_andersonii.AAC.1